MAYIICIDKATYREGINNIGDIVDVVDQAHPDVYSTFRVIEIEGEAEDVKAELRAKEPKVETLLRWQDSKTGEWFQVEKEPKYMLNAANVTDENDLDLVEDNLSNKPENKTNKISITSFFGG